MKWSSELLVQHLLHLKNNSRLPHNILLVTSDQNHGTDLIKKLANLKNLNSNRIFLFRYDSDFEVQKAQITKLIYWTNLTTQTDQYVYFYIPELENYSPLFYNRLLKILEDHRSQIVGIFQAAHSHKLLPTLRSRCQEFVLKPTEQTCFKNELFNEFEQRFFTLINANSEQYHFVNLFPMQLSNLDFWIWFQKLLKNWHNQTKTESILNKQISFILSYGWKLILRNHFAEQKFNFQLDGNANWILFVFELCKNLSIIKKNNIQLKYTLNQQ